MKNEYVSLLTGELVVGIKGVIITAFTDLIRCHIFNFRWEKWHGLW